MQKLFVVVVISLLTCTAHAQEKTLFSGTVEHGGFGAPVIKFADIKGELGVMVGGYGGWLIDHTLMLGAGGFGLATDIRAERSAELLYDAPGTRPLYLDFGYGGGVIEVILRSDDLVHLYANVLAGGGAVSYRRSWLHAWNDDARDDDDRDDSHHHYGGYDVFFVLEPSINAELNLTTWMRVGAGVSYRYITGIGMLNGVSNKDVSGLSTQLTAKFGVF